MLYRRKYCACVWDRDREWERERVRARESERKKKGEKERNFKGKILESNKQKK